MQIHGDKVGVKVERSDSPSKLAWLVAGVGIGAVAGILLAPQCGEDTREWISIKCDNGMNTARARVKRTRRQVEDWIGQGQERITDGVDAGREAFNKRTTEAGF
jgi:gas vesicle protein